MTLWSKRFPEFLCFNFCCTLFLFNVYTLSRLECGMMMNTGLTVFVGFPISNFCMSKYFEPVNWYVNIFSTFRKSIAMNDSSRDLGKIFQLTTQFYNYQGSHLVAGTAQKKSIVAGGDQLASDDVGISCIPASIFNSTAFLLGSAKLSLVSWKRSFSAPERVRSTKARNVLAGKWTEGKRRTTGGFEVRRTRSPRGSDNCFFPVCQKYAVSASKSK